MTSVFVSYSHADEELRLQLDIHLTMLKREGEIDVWHDRRIPPGDQIDNRISESLERANVVLLLVSPDFLASAYCFDVEVKRAMERHEAGDARVIPVILRPCDWQRAPFGKLSAVPRDGKPITKWPDRDEAFLEVVKGIRQSLSARKLQKPRQEQNLQTITSAAPITRSSNLRLKREFTEADQDRFLDDAFQFVALFFENSLSELEQRNRGISTSFKKLGADRFTAVVYRNGKAMTRCSIRLGGRRGFGGGITFSHNDDPSPNSFNESMSIEVGPNELSLRALGMAGFGNRKAEHLSMEGAAEYFWSLFIEPVQR